MLDERVFLKVPSTARSKKFDMTALPSDRCGTTNVTRMTQADAGLKAHDHAPEHTNRYQKQAY